MERRQVMTNNNMTLLVSWAKKKKKEVLIDTIRHENVLIGYITHINWINLLYNPKFLEKDWAAKNSKLFLSRYLGRKASVSKSPVAKPWYAISTKMKIFLFWKKKKNNKKQWNFVPLYNHLSCLHFTNLSKKTKQEVNT